MKKNMGSADRTIRIVLAVAFALLYFTNIVTGVFGIILLVFAFVFLLTGFIGYCPLYSLLKFSTTEHNVKV
ncbi:MAG TPA: DUF2892 domain-containing protein [Saprospiraceae bacterium]|nr:DUF2892 domain-containing protein [Saprospiraceae bacterium]